MSRRPYIGPSEAQSRANAEALARRGSPHVGSYELSVRVAWDYRKRAPRDLREAERAVIRAYADETPTRLHEGPDAIGPDGTPKMTQRAEGYIFGNERSDDAGRDPETGERDLIGYYHAPFRARLAAMEQGDEARRKHAAIVRDVVFGQRSGTEAAMGEGVPSWCAGLVAEHALRSFLQGLSDISVHPPDRVMLSEGITAA